MNGWESYGAVRARGPLAPLAPRPDSAAPPEAVGVRAEQDRGHEAAHVEVGAWPRAVESFGATIYLCVYLVWAITNAIH